MLTRVLYPSHIALRLLAFNLLVLFLPIGGIFYLDVYESRLLEAQERAMVQQGRLAAAALGDAPILDPSRALAIMQRLGERGDARIRVYDAGGALLADSVSVRSADEWPPQVAPVYPQQGTIRSRVLYRLGAGLATVRRMVGRLLTPEPAMGPAEIERKVAPEIEAALAGRYGAATRRTPGQRSLTLNSAVPIRHNESVIGAVVVSQSTFRVLQALYDVRLRLFEVVLASLLFAAVLTAIAAATVVRPLGRLRRTALDLADRRAQLPGRFVDADRRDEIGDLARSLEELTRRLHEHIRSVEQFASDVAHEFKNPLAAIRTAAEMAGDAATPAERQRFLQLMTRDVDRLERLVTDLRELARIDAQLEQEPLAHVDVRHVLAETIEGLKLAAPDLADVHVTASPQPCIVRASADRLAQVFENVLSNARSFAPPNTAVDVTCSRDGRHCSVTIEDRGPGIPEAHLSRLFDRFFSYRPADSAGAHAGLGLAIARTIVTGYGGTISARNRPEGGAVFEIRLPVSRT